MSLDTTSSKTTATAEQAFLPIQRVPFSNTPIILTAVFLTITWLLASLRTWTRARILRNWGWDDWTMLVAIAFFTVFIIAFLMTALIVRRKDTLTRTELQNFTNWLLVTEDFYMLTALALKVPLSIFFLRIMVKQWEKNMVYVTLAVCTLFNIAYFFFAVFQCGVFGNAFQFWMKLTSNQCITPTQILGVSYTHAVLTAITDWTFAILPISMLKDSQLATREKSIVGFILALGGMGSIASIVRIVYVPRLANLTLAFYSDALQIGVWSSIELGLGVSAACLATLRPLLRIMIQRARTLATGSALSKGSQAMTMQSYGSQPMPLSRETDIALLDIGNTIPWDDTKPTSSQTFANFSQA